VLRDNAHDVISNIRNSFEFTPLEVSHMYTTLHCGSVLTVGIFVLLCTLLLAVNEMQSTRASPSPDGVARKRSSRRASLQNGDLRLESLRRKQQALEVLAHHARRWQLRYGFEMLWCNAYADGTQIASELEQHAPAFDFASNKRSHDLLSKEQVEACFKHEREAYAHDIRQLHRQLEAKDRERAKERATAAQAAASTQTELRAIRARLEEADRDRAALQAAKRSCEELLTASVQLADERGATASELHTRLRHADKLHREQLELERRQQRLMLEEATSERRNLEALENEQRGKRTVYSIVYIKRISLTAQHQVL
jgi:hypothetical protein